jgi:hypothetical protein
MRPKIIEKKKALSLRRQGRSLKEISDELDISKSSASIWCRDIKLTNLQFEVLKCKRPDKNYGALANKAKREEQVLYLRDRARRDVRRLNLSDTRRLRDIGAAIYWAEGAKRGNYIDFTNSDPKMVLLMMNWFRTICEVREDKFKISVFYHEGQNEILMKKYWSKITGIPLSQFHKSIFKREGTGQRRNILYNGTCKVRVCDSDLLHKVLAWIEQLDMGH